MPYRKDEGISSFNTDAIIGVSLRGEAEAIFLLRLLRRPAYCGTPRNDNRRALNASVMVIISWEAAVHL